MKKSKSIQIPIYGGFLIVVVSGDYQFVNSKIDGFKHESNDDLFAYFLYGDYNGKKGYYIVLNPNDETKITAPIIAHESLHATMQICKNAGIIMDADNPEPVTYLLEWVTKEVLEFYEQSTKKTKK